MHILVINGSPKGKYSVTLQTVRYLECRFPDHTFEVLDAGKRIKSLEKDFSPAIEAIGGADLLLFSYPVYTFLAPSQLHRFIELLKAANLDLSEKFASQITTSKHFYDVTAHRYVEDNCHDLGLKVIRGLSADMDDLLTKKGQAEAEAYFRFLLYAAEHGLCEEAADKPSAYAPHIASSAEPEKKRAGKVSIVTDCGEADTSLRAMIARFQAVLPYETEVFNIREFPFSGGCLGCFHCASDGQCVYKDGFDTVLRERIQSASAIVTAFTVSDHSMGARFKLYDDRQFCNGHRTVTMGMPMGYLVSGKYASEYNLQTVLTARADVGGNYLAGIATDEADVDAAIDRMAKKLAYAIEQKYTEPQRFYGIGGMKIFRDLIYIMQGFMRADHRFYKAHGQYDFPQKQWKTKLKMQLVGGLIANKKIRDKMGNAMNEGMLMPYEKLLKKIKE